MSEQIITRRQQEELALSDDPQVLLDLLDYPHDRIPRLVAYNENATAEVIRKAYERGIAVSFYAISQHPNTPVDILEHLSENDDTYVKSGVAENPSTPIQILETFLDSAQEVRRSLAGNPSISSDIAEKLSRDTAPVVRSRIIDNAKLPLRCLEELAKDPDWIVRLEVAEHSLCPNPESMFKDESSFVREAIARRSDIGEQALRTLAEDYSDRVKKAVLGNTNTPFDVATAIMENTYVERAYYGDEDGPEADLEPVLIKTESKYGTLIDELAEKIERAAESKGEQKLIRRALQKRFGS